MSTITEKAWKKVGKYHHHGINIPLSAIWTNKSCGNGEFLDLLPLIDFCSSVQFDVIQLLPLNDSGLNQSPYNALSSIALHPIYLSLHALPHISTDLQKKIKTFQRFNKHKHILYHHILKEKQKWLEQYVEIAGPIISLENRYQSFVQSNEWLYDYALFKILKKKYHNQTWQQWNESEKNCSNQERKKLCETHKKEVEFYSIIQYLCMCQLKKVKSYAEKKKVFLKGDIPILLSSDSADVWIYKDFFDLNLMMGSPPNKFDSLGQLWNLPLYNWKVLELNHFEWWKKRINHASEYFHIYRVDHILGFFRAWAIPQNQKPEQGHFVPNNESLMESQGRLLLKKLASFSNMLPIGEDLGDPPSFVRSVMKEYGIPGTYIFHRYRNWKNNGSFIPVKNYPPISLSSVSTHDIDTVNVWWNKFPEEAKDYASFKKWTYYPKLTLEQNYDILYDCHHSGSFFHINLLQEYLALIPDLTWDDPYDELINIPNNKSSHNWSYRYKFPLNSLLKNEQLKTLFQNLLL